MKNRLLWLAVIAATAAAFYFLMIKPAVAPPAPKPSPLAGLRPPPLPAPELPKPSFPSVVPLVPPPPTTTVVRRPNGDSAPGVEVPIQEGATIDFSTGAPNVRSQGSDKEAIDRALRQIEEATRDMTFPPTKK